MKVQVDAGGFARDIRAACTAELTRVTKTIDEEIKAGGDGLRADLKRETEALLGVRVANAWRGKFYPNKGQAGGPASFVWSKAPKILDFFSSSKIVTPKGGAFAIPTENVPRGSRGRRLSPIEVEARFNAELQPVKLTSGHIGLVIDVAGGKAAGGRRRSRPARPVLMFILTKGPLQGRQLIDLADFASRWAGRTADNIEKRLERGI